MDENRMRTFKCYLLSVFPTWVLSWRRAIQRLLHGIGAVLVCLTVPQIQRINWKGSVNGIFGALRWTVSLAGWAGPRRGHAEFAALISLMWDEAWKHKCSRPPGTAACPICVKAHEPMMPRRSGLVQPHLRCGSGSMLQPPSITYGNGNWFWILDSAQSKTEKMHIQWPSGSQRFDNYWFCHDENMLFPFLAFQFQRLLITLTCWHIFIYHVCLQMVAFFIGNAGI